MKQEKSDISTEKESRTHAMYSRLRYPNLDAKGNAIYVRHRRFVYERLGIDVDDFFRGKVVLDAGCGTGEETLFLASLGPAKVVGIDTSSGSLEVAWESAVRTGAKNVEFIEASVLDESVFPDENFDYVSSLGCIHHTPNTHRAFHNLGRMVRPGGHLCTFLYNSYGHFLYNLQCDALDRWVGNDVDERVRVARRFFDWRWNKTFYREGIPAAYEARMYDKYGVLYRDSLALKELLGWYSAAGFEHAGSFPMYLRDMLDSARARDIEGRLPGGFKGQLAGILDRVLPAQVEPRAWTWKRRTAMQGLLLLMSLYDYGSAFRILAIKQHGKESYTQC